MNSGTFGSFSQSTPKVVTKAVATLVVSLAGLLSIACSTDDPKAAKSAPVPASSSSQNSASTAAKKPEPVVGIRDSSGDGESVVAVRRSDRAQADGQGELALVAACAKKSYSETDEESASAACNAPSEANETR